MGRLNEFKILKKKLLNHTKIVDLYLEDIQTPKGNIVEWVHIDHPGAAAILPIDDEGKIILIRQFRNNAEQVVYEIPAGGLEKGESPKECAIRELEEEIGYKSDNITELFTLYSSIGICNEKISYYLAKDLKLGKTNFDEDEYIEICKFTVDEVLEMIKNNIIVDSKVIIAVMSYIVMNK